jgi:endo-1,4-beta-xylanase
MRPKQRWRSWCENSKVMAVKKTFLFWKRSVLFGLPLIFSCLTCFSQSNVLSNPGFEQNTAGWFGFGPVSLTTVASPVHSGSLAARIQNRTDTWNGVAQSLLGVLQVNSTYTISAWVRIANSANQSVLLTIQKTDANGTTYQTVASGTASSNGWTQISGAYTLNVSGTLTGLTLYMEGPAAGVDFYADDFVVNGFGAGYDWKAAANTRIEQIRKRDLRLLVVDPSGNPVPGVAISLTQRKHQFAFGSAINFNISLPQYTTFFKTNFEWAVMENESKWYSNETSRSNVNYTAADSITNFCYTNSITLRGHSIFWAVDQWVQPWVTNLSNPELLVAVTNRLNSAVNHFKGTFKHWDVNNEMLHGNFYGNRVGNWINPWMFQYAHALDPNALLFVNDYNVVAGNETDAYKQQIQNLIASNAPVQAIGVQGHFGSTIDPTVTEVRLDNLGQLGLPIWITEYDSLNSDENIRADNLETLYRIAFSKQYVDGIMMWGFWAGSHWRGAGAAIVNLDWSLNEAGRRYQSLLSEWTTQTNGVTGPDGAFDSRGFHGDYDVTLTPPGGQPTLRRITLASGSGTSTNRLIINPTDSRPVLVPPANLPINGQFAFQVVGDAGRTNQIQTSTTLTNWTPVTNLYNPNGTVTFTNPGSPSQTQLFFRAKVLP